MKDRIRQIMESLQMTQSEFADYIGLAPATLSSIFNGRTRPTLNVVEALKKKIPDINIDWLLMGFGEMYHHHSTPAEDTLHFPDDDVDQTPKNPNPMFDFAPSPVSNPQNGPSTPSNFNSVKSTHPEITREEVKIVDKPQRRVLEIRVFYDDQTWETFVPTRK